MIRISEMVLAGHPDKFCDQVADAVISEAMEIDLDADGQVEIAGAPVARTASSSPQRWS